MGWWQQYNGALRGFRPLYTLHNWRHREELEYNKELYRKFGVKKPVVSPVSTADFEHLPQPEAPWLDSPHAHITGKEAFKKFPEDIREQLIDWNRNGYLVWKGFFDNETVDIANSEVDRLLQGGQTEFNYTGKKIMQAWKHSDHLKNIVTESTLLGLMEFILGKKVIPFHTINFLYGSEQKAHSDALHMATYPRGFLIAAWIALDKIEKDNGPLFYYPASHRLPYPTNKSIGTTSNAFWLDQEANKKYEEHVAGLLKKHGLKKQEFYAEPGDLFIWHANLVHGGAPHLNAEKTRRSMVMHYFAEGVIPYHEISERPAIFEKEMLEFYQRSVSSGGGA